VVKIFSYFDEWLNTYFNFHRSLDYPYNWVIPLLEFCLLFVITYYVSYFIPRREAKQDGTD
jgi:hypothetical protein